MIRVFRIFSSTEVFGLNSWEDYFAESFLWKTNCTYLRKKSEPPHVSAIQRSLWVVSVTKRTLSVPPRLLHSSPQLPLGRPSEVKEWEEKNILSTFLSARNHRRDKDGPVRTYYSEKRTNMHFKRESIRWSFSPSFYRSDLVKICDREKVVNRWVDRCHRERHTFREMDYL